MTFLKNVSIKNLFLYFSLFFIGVIFMSFLFSPETSIPENLPEEINLSFFEILVNNIKAVLLLIFFTPLTLGVSGLFIIIINGILLGNSLGNINGNIEFSLLLIPHGIIEMSAFILAACIGLRFTLDLLFNVKIRWRRYSILIGTVLLGITFAAFIETFYTPQLLKFIK